MAQEENPFSRDHWAPASRGTLGFELALLEAAQFIAAALASGVVGNAAFQYLTSLRRRDGIPKITELKDEVYKALKKVKHKPHVSDSDLRLRTEDLFKDFEQ